MGRLVEVMGDGRLVDRSYWGKRSRGGKGSWRGGGGEAGGRWEFFLERKC